MSLPSSMLKILENHKVEYNVMARPARLSLVPTEKELCIVRSSLLQDSTGRVQILLPSTHMVDLDSAFRQFGRRFEGVPIAEIRPLISSHQLTCIPALPSWEGMQTLVDSSLLSYDKLLLDTGDSSQMIELKRDDFKEIIQHAEVGNFTIATPPLDLQGDQDEEQIFESVKKFTQLRIKQRLEETLEMPPLPKTAQRIIALRANPDADINDLTSIVEIDPSLAAQVVSWAASPYYSAPGKITSVHDAIVRVLGFDMVLNLALGLALGKTLSTEALTKEQIDEYWQNAVYSAAAIEGLVTSIEKEFRPSFGMSYLSGLLNNFGQLVFADVFSPYLTKITQLSLANPHLNAALIENHLLGVTGGQVAAWLLDSWNMPSEVIITLRHQLNPSYDGHHATYPKLMYIVRHLLAERGIGTHFGSNIPDSLYEELHLDQETAEITIDNLVNSSDDLDGIVNQMKGN